MAQKGSNTAIIKSSEIIPVTGKTSKKPPLPKGLTEKQKQFCREYVYDWNARRSYLKVYDGVKKTSTADAAASRLLSNVKVEAYITEIQKDLEKLSGISKKMVLDEHKKLAFASTSQLFEDWITRKEFNALSEEAKSCISEIDTKFRTEWEYDPGKEKKVPVRVEYVRVKLYDKQKSLESISKMLGYDAPTKTALTDKEGNDVIPMVIFRDFNEKRD